ncbi:MAG: hypothetical protein HZB23_11890 [Deltaproteobacteria bacterium]|nr:hypothetical protein [Deltaproteobacteria bacterium]
MPTDILNIEDIKPGDIYEDIFYHPCLCLSVTGDEVMGISLVDGSCPRFSAVGLDYLRKLRIEEAWIWRMKGPQPLSEDELERIQSIANKWWSERSYNKIEPRLNKELYIKNAKPEKIGIKKEFFKLLSDDLIRKETISGFEKLLVKARAANYSIALILEAILLANEYDIVESFKKLAFFINKKSFMTPFALLARGRIYCDKLCNYENALIDFNTINTMEDYMGDLKEWILILGLYLKGNALYYLGKMKEAIVIFDEVIENFGEGKELFLDLMIGNAMFRKATILDKGGKKYEAINLYNDLIVKFGNRDEISLVELTAWSFIYKGISLDTIECKKEAIDTFSELIIRFSDHEEVCILELVGIAFIQKCIILYEMRMLDDSDKVANEVIKRFGRRKKSTLKQFVNKALALKLSASVCNDDSKGSCYSKHIINLFQLKSISIRPRLEGTNPLSSYRAG